MRFAALTRRTALAIGVLAFFYAGALAQGFSLISPSSATSLDAPSADSVVVMPFENRSQIAKYNWICDSFAILIGDLLDEHGMKVINIDNRNLAFEKMHLSPSDLLTRAAMIRVAGAADANLALVGEFDIGESKEDATISIMARLIETREGRLVPNKTFNYSGSLSALQEWQGQLAWNIVYERNQSDPYSKEQMIQRAKRVPVAAYESFVKGVQTRDLKMRESFLQRSIQESENSGQQARFSQAIYELGILYYRENEFDEAAKTLKKMEKDDPSYLESLFYLGLAAYKAGDFDASAQSFENLIGVTTSPEVLNNAGVAFLAKGDSEKAQGFLRQAISAAPTDMLYRFNLGYSLWRVKNYTEAGEHLRAVAQADPHDGEVQFLLSKTLAASGMQTEAAQADNEAKRYLSSYAKWAVTPDRIPTLARLKEELNPDTVNKLESRSRVRTK